MILTAGACGIKHPPLSDDDLPGRPDAGVGEAAFIDFGAEKPKCQVQEDGGSCGCFDINVLTDVPNLYFVLDRSGSMADVEPGKSQNKWNVVRLTVVNIVRSLGPRAASGVTIFPGLQGLCTSGSETMGVRPGDSPAGYAGPTSEAVSTATSIAATGGTPTAQTLIDVLPRLQGLSGRTYVILATDGGPNCNKGAACDEHTCLANLERADQMCVPDTAPNCCTPDLFGPEMCLDADASTAAVKALKDAGIPTYVIGVPGSAPYAAVLDRMAQAGGTARASSPFYYRVDDTDAFGTAMRAIAAKVIARCDLPLDPVPPDPSHVNVFFDDQVVPPDPQNGWTFDGKTINLVGSACSKVMAGEILSLRVVGGCPTVAPK